MLHRTPALPVQAALCSNQWGRYFVPIPSMYRPAAEPQPDPARGSVRFPNRSTHHHRCAGQRHPATRTVGIVHLDVEGYQNEALPGAAKIVERNLPIVIVEGKLHEETLHWLAGLGYRQTRAMNNSAVWTPHA